MGVEPGLGKGVCSGCRVTLWRGEGLSLLLAPAHWVNVGAAGVTPGTQEHVTVPNETWDALSLPSCDSKASGHTRILLLSELHRG